MFTEGGLA